MAERLESLASAIERVLEQSAQSHAALLSLMQRKRAALAAADTGAMVELSRLENEQVQQIGELEKSRQELVARLTLVLRSDAAEPMPLRDLAMRLPEPMRSRLLARRQQLRERIEQVREQASVTKRATEALARHVQGLVQTIHSFAAGGAAYNGRGGAPDARRAGLHTINLVA